MRSLGQWVQGLGFRVEAFGGLGVFRDPLNPLKPLYPIKFCILSFKL